MDNEKEQIPFQTITLRIENIKSIVLNDPQHTYRLVTLYNGVHNEVPSDGTPLGIEPASGVTLEFQLRHPVENEHTEFVIKEIDLEKGKGITQLKLKANVDDPDPVTVTVEIEDEIGSGQES